LRVRLATRSDIPAMIKLERDAPGAGHWSQEQYERIFGATHCRQPSERFAWVAEYEGEQRENLSPQAVEILGFLVAHRIDSEWELENIAVAIAVRRQGLGARLLNEFTARALAEGAVAIFLEVRESNQSARALYRKAGFLETGLRRGYYANPPEDAILCRLSLY
jgi:[ribosomal protein S18]-alanine N-acetyltransferase